MNAEASLPEESGADQPLVEDLRLRLQGALTQETLARAEARRLMRELAVARRLLRFFVDAPTPARSSGTAGVRPVPATLLTAETRFHLDACRREDKHVEVTGWAFCPVAAWDGHAAAIVVVLRHAAGAYAAAASRMPRPDIAAHFATLPTAASGGARGLDGTGFTCQIVNDSLPAGVDLEIVLRLECGGIVCEQPTGERLRL